MNHFNYLSAENVIAFAWEPVGSRFAFIHGESPRISVSFYQIRPGKVETISKKDSIVNIIKICFLSFASFEFWFYIIFCLQKLWKEDKQTTCSGVLLDSLLF